MKSIFRLLPYFIGTAVVYFFAISTKQFGLDIFVIASSISFLLLAYFFVWYNVWTMNSLNVLTKINVLSPNRLGHLLVLFGGPIAGYGFAINQLPFMLAGFGAAWFGGELLTKTRNVSVEEYAERVINQPTAKTLSAYFCRQILDGVSESLGQGKGKPAELKAGVYNLGDLSSITPFYPIYLASKYTPLAGKNDAIHIVIAKNSYKIYSYSSGMREQALEIKEFNSFLELTENIVEKQITMCMNELAQEDEEYEKVRDNKNYDNMLIQTNYLAKYRKESKEKINTYINSKKAMFINWLISIVV